MRGQSWEMWAMKRFGEGVRGGEVESGEVRSGEWGGGEWGGGEVGRWGGWVFC